VFVGEQSTAAKLLIIYALTINLLQESPIKYAFNELKRTAGEQASDSALATLQ